MVCHAVLDGISPDYPAVAGRLHTCYSPVRRSPADKASFIPAAPRLACVKPVASVHPEPGSNSPLLLSLFFFFLCQSRMNRHLKRSFRIPTASERHCFPADNLESKRWSNLTETSSVDRLAPGPRPLFSCTTSSIAIISMCSVLNVRPKLGGNVLQSYNQFLKPANL